MTGLVELLWNLLDESLDRAGKVFIEEVLYSYYERRELEGNTSTTASCNRGFPVRALRSTQLKDAAQRFKDTVASYTQETLSLLLNTFRRGIMLIRSFVTAAASLC